MTDLLPNVTITLSSDLFDDDPCLESMSAQATAVLDAYMTGYGWLDGPTKKDCSGVAATLRAAADQLGYCRAPDEFEHLYGRIVEVDDLLAIAAELEGTTTTSKNN